MVGALLAVLIGGPLSLFALRWRVHSVANPLIHELPEVQEAEAALILGAYVYPNGTPCKVL